MCPPTTGGKFINDVIRGSMWCYPWTNCGVMDCSITTNDITSGSMWG